MTPKLSARPATRTLAFCAALMLVTVGLSGCGRRARVLDVHDHPAMLGSGTPATSRTTHAAVLRALANRGYEVTSDDGRVVMARMKSGDVWALMRIEASDGTYSISHADSSDEFLYDAQRNTVHRRYNRWVNNLAGSIDEQLNESRQLPSRRGPTVVVAPRSVGNPKPEPQETSRPVERQAPPIARPQASDPSDETPPASEPLPPRPPGAIDI